jgi:predicted RNase H-like nuclease (RuvC/YqgF family)
MDQQTYPTVIPASTEQFLNTQISVLQEAIEKKDAMIISLQDRMSAMSQRSYSDSAEKNRMVESMQEWTMEELSNSEITESQAQEIAEIMGFDLTKEVEVEVTVTYNLTLQVPHDEDVESIVNDIDFESVQYNSDNITWLSASVDRIDF